MQAHDFALLPLALASTLALPARAEPTRPAVASRSPDARASAPRDASLNASAAADDMAQRPPRCEAHLRVVACVMNSRRPERSKAAIRNPHGVRVLGPGQRLDDWVLVAVAPTHALLRGSSGQTCYIPVYLPASERKQVVEPASRAPRPAATRQTPSDGELRRAIRSVAPGRYAVTRKMLERLVANPRALLHNTRVRSLVRDGHSAGMVISKLRDGSPLAMLGLRQGDVLVRINDQALTTGGRALTAIAGLSAAREVTLSLLRDNRPVQLTVVLD